MGRFWAMVGVAICTGAAQAQTFVPKLDPPAEDRSTSRYFGERSDLEKSIGRVAEAPKLAPSGMSPLDNPSEPVAAEEASSSGVPVAVGGVVLSLLAGVLIFWIRRNARPARPRTGHSA